MIFASLWVYQTLFGHIQSFVSNSDFWNRPGARDITIFGSHVDPHIPNIGYMGVYTGYGGI